MTLQTTDSARVFMTAETMFHWRNQAACLGQDREMFFPISDDGRDTMAAKVVCAECPVKQPCLEWALANGADFGVWGGLTSQERRALLAGRRKSRMSLLR